MYNYAVCEQCMLLITVIRALKLYILTLQKKWRWQIIEMELKSGHKMSDSRLVGVINHFSVDSSGHMHSASI